MDPVCHRQPGWLVTLFCVRPVSARYNCPNRSLPLKLAPNHGADKKIFAHFAGFCAGVVRAIDVVKIALDLYGPPVYVRKEIVHNKHVVEELRAAGAVFVEELDEVPSGARAIFSAHGVSPAVRRQARERQLDVIDATCPLVTKVHLEAVRFARDGFSIVLIGHRDHDEVIGTLGEVPERSYLVETLQDVDSLEIPDPARVRYLTQTTLSLDETTHLVNRLKERFPLIEGPQSQDICYATENRQMAVKAVSANVDLLLVVGSENSSNSNRLVEVGDSFGVNSHLVNDRRDVDSASGRRKTSALRPELRAGAPGAGTHRVFARTGIREPGRD